MSMRLDFKNPRSVMEFLQKPTLQIAEALTGILCSDSKDWKLSAGHIVQAIIRGDLLTQLGQEIKTYQDTGKIKRDIFETDFNRASLKEIIGFIDSETPDGVRFRAMKSVFLGSLETTADEVLTYELMKICRQLSSMEIMILSANYNVVKGTAKPTAKGIEWGAAIRIEYWAQIIAEQIGHNLPEIVLQYEEHLIALKLISDRHYPIDRTRVTENFEKTQYFRLTSLGYKLCEFITKYD